MKTGNSARIFAAASALLLSGTMLTVTDAEARTNRAVLVAVTKYPNVQGADLAGPNNDAELVREFLTTSAPVPFAAEDVTVLADDLDGAAASPTRQAVIDALADVAAEPDGLDEVFLPADISPWVDRSKGIPSAFPDDEIGDAVQAIRDKGAFVWIVIDTCHSGTATRSLDGDVTYRKIDPDQLGIPESAFKEAVGEAGGGEPQRDALGHASGRLFRPLARYRLRSGDARRHEARPGAECQGRRADLSHGERAAKLTHRRRAFRAGGNRSSRSLHRVLSDPV